MSFDFRNNKRAKSIGERSSGEFRESFSRSHGLHNDVVGMETRDYIRRHRSLISRDRPYPEEISGAMPPKWHLPNAGHATEPTLKLARFDSRSVARASCFADFARKCLPNASWNGEGFR